MPIWEVTEALKQINRALSAGRQVQARLLVRALLAEAVKQEEAYNLWAEEEAREAEMALPW